MSTIGNHSAVLEQAPSVPSAPFRLYGEPSVHVKVHCGCGFHCSTLTEAAAHARGVGHTLTISGEVRAQF